MACRASPRARSAHDEALRLFPGTFSSGIVGDSAHAVRTSGHNCGALNEVGSPDATADDVHVPDQRTGMALLEGSLKSPDLLYAIYRGTGYRPDWRVERGEARTFDSSGHPDHVHRSWTLASRLNTAPIFGAAPESPFDWGALLPFLNVQGDNVNGIVADEKGRIFEVGRNDSGGWRYHIATPARLAELEKAKEIPKVPGRSRLKLSNDQIQDRWPTLVKD